MRVETHDTEWCEIWNSYEEFVDKVGNNANPLSSDNVSGSREWDLSVGSLSKAVGLAHGGWADARPDVDKVLSSLTDRLDHKYGDRYNTVMDVTGGFVDVGTYMSGVPECMVQFVQEPDVSVGRVVRIMNSSGFLSGVDGTAVLRRGVAIIALVEVLHKMGFGVELWNDSSIDGKKDDGYSSYATVVKLHDSAEPMDINKIIFAVAHPAYHRRLVFSAREMSTKHKGMGAGNGYGSTVNSLYEKHADFDVKIPALRPGDNALIARDPLAWVINTLDGMGF